MEIEFRGCAHTALKQLSRKRIVSIVALVFGVGTAFAQSPPVPSAGEVLKTMPVPSSKADVNVQVDGSAAKARAVADVEGMKLEIKGFQIVGMTVMKEADLASALAPFIGANKRFQEMLDAAAAVKRELAQRGYFLADVIIPEQKIDNGIVILQVLEGRLGKVRLELDANVSVRRSLLESYLNDLVEGELINTATVERALFQIHDLRGIVARSSFVPGAAPGTAG